MPQKFQITRAAELESLQEIRTFITECCAVFNVPSNIVLELKLAVDEACTNIITHGYQDMDPGSVILAFWIETDKILVQITDFGHPFEPVEAPKPDFEGALVDQELGGLGLFLIYQTMDNIDYQASMAGNTLTFTKFFTRGTAA
jgi:serine/threonine-protein kinase RsbW